MAALPATKVGLRMPIGEYFAQVFRVEVTSVAAADEWIETGAGEIITATGAVVVGPAAAIGASVVPNAQGTGEAEGSSPGDLGIETTAATTVNVTIIQKA